MLGAVAGDIIGSPYEWNNTDDRYFELCHSTRGWYRGREVSYHPKFTDDTVMTLAVARWLMQDAQRLQPNLIRIMKDMARRYPDRGFGPRFRRWAEGEGTAPVNSFGNGAAMRVSPVGLVAESLPEALSLARQQAEVSHSHPEAIRGAQAIAQAVWMARHSRSKDDIRFATEQEFGYDLGIDAGELRFLLQGCVREPVIVNGEETGGYYYRETGKFNSSCQDTVPAAIIAFLQGDSFEDTVRRAVAMGGDSDTIASMAGAIAEPFYGGVPEKIRGLCDSYLDEELRSLMESFERIMIRKEVRSGKVDKEPDDMFKVLRIGEEKVAYVVSGYRKDIIAALKEKYGDGITVIGPRKEEQWLRENYPYEARSGTYIAPPLADCRYLYYKDGVFHSPTTYPFANGASLEERKHAFNDFLRMKQYALEVRQKLQALGGYHGEGSIHFATAYFPVVYQSGIEVWKGDTFAGSIGIDPMSGLLKVTEGGDLGPCEWGEDRCFSVFYGTSLDSFREALSHWCLDEGVGIESSAYRLNADRVYNDITASEDKALNEKIESGAKKFTNGICIR